MRRFILPFLVAVFGFSGAAVAQTGDAILILDASGSMWGQVDGQTKISAARKAVDSILSKWKTTDRLGLMAYGHRSKGDCSDIELVVPVDAFDAEKIRSAVRRLSPKGKTPMADSLRAAAQALRASENKATVILVSDGIETCSPDPCAVAAELKKAGVNFTAHVIGFDVTDPAAKRQLQCIARATGGVYLDASNASGLENALGKAVEATQGTKVQSQAPVRPEAEPDPLKGRNFRGLARLAAGADPISGESGLAWIFFKVRPDGKKGELAASVYGAPANGEVPPGEYIVEVNYRQVTREFPFKVEKGKLTELDVVLDAGYVTSEGAIEGAGKADRVTWDVHNVNGAYVATDYAALPRFVLPAGNYVLTLTKGASKTRKEFSVAAGDSINVSLTLDVGVLAVSAVYAADGPKIEQGIAVEINRPAQNNADKPQWIATQYDAVSRFEVPAGSYEVVVSVGHAKRSFRAEVKSGDTARVNFNLDAGIAGIRAPEGSTIEIYSAERDINNRRAWIATHYDSDLSVALNAGNYVVVVIVKGDKKSEHAISVVPGKRVEVSVK